MNNLFRATVSSANRPMRTERVSTSSFLLPLPALGQGGFLKDHEAPTEGTRTSSCKGANRNTMADIIERDRGPRGRRLVLLLFAHVLVFSSFLLLPQSARAASYQPNSREATERDKDTHRAVRAESTYDLTDASHRFTSQAFAGGLRTDAQVFSNFEDWRIGTHGWTLNGDHDSHAPTRGAHFNSFSFALLPALVARTGTTLRFDTDAATVVYGSVTQNGAATQVSDGAATKVVVFNVGVSTLLALFLYTSDDVVCK